MTRNVLMFGGTLAGILFLSTLTLAEDPPKESSTTSHQPIGSVEASKQTRVYLGGVSLTSGYNRFSWPAYWGTPFYGYYGRSFGLLSGQVILHTADLLFLASIQPTIFNVAQTWGKSNCKWNR